MSSEQQPLRTSKEDASMFCCVAAPLRINRGHLVISVGSTDKFEPSTSCKPSPWKAFWRLACNRCILSLRSRAATGNMLITEQ